MPEETAGEDDSRDGPHGNRGRVFREQICEVNVELGLLPQFSKYPCQRFPRGIPEVDLWKSSGKPLGPKQSGLFHDDMGLKSTSCGKGGTQPCVLVWRCFVWH